MSQKIVEDGSTVLKIKIIFVYILSVTEETVRDRSVIIIIASQERKVLSGIAWLEPYAFCNNVMVASVVLWLTLSRLW